MWLLRGRSYQPSRIPRLITLIETLTKPDIAKTESNNCSFFNIVLKKTPSWSLHARTLVWHYSWKSCIARATYRSVGYQCIIIRIIIRSKFFFLFIGREPTTWPTNNCLQIMVCSCAMRSNCVWLHVIFCTCVKETVLFSFLRSLLRENGRSLRFPRIFIKKTNWVTEW